MSENLVEALTTEILRVTEIHGYYIETAEDETGIQKQILLSLALDIQNTIDIGRQAHGTGDILQMIPALQDLQAIHE